MTKDDIIKLALEAGFELPWSMKDQEKLEAFANLVAAAEREACAKVCEERGMVKGGEVFSARIRARGTT